jgi:hypothetical protein
MDCGHLGLTLNPKPRSGNSEKLTMVKQAFGAGAQHSLRWDFS